MALPTPQTTASDAFDPYDGIVPNPNKKKNPLVLVGTLATAGVLVAGLVAFRQGNQRVSQSMMRARVAFQGATVATMLASSMFVLNKDKASGEAAGAARGGEAR